MIHNLTTTWFSFHPDNSKWWCRGAILKKRLPVPVFLFVYLKYKTCIITDRDSITNTPPIIINKILYLSRTANVPIAAPRDKDPTSPINTFAG